MNEPNSPVIAARYVVNARSLRLRASPSLDGEAIGTLQRSTVVQLLDGAEGGSVWAHVQAGKKLGWVARKYLTPEDHQAAPPSPEEEFPWMPVALGELGVSEWTEPGKSNPRVEAYLLSTDLDRELARNDSTPWCSGLVNWCVEKAGYAGTNSAAARSWIDWGRPLAVPRRGVITVLSRGAGHHVGFFIRKDTGGPGGLGRLWLLGGNQANQVSIAGYDATRLLGYRVPAR